MKTVREIVDTKGSTVWSITPDATVYDALKLMAEKEIGALLVLDQGQVLGILSERDYARKVILKGKFSKDVPVREIMTDRVLYVRPRQTVEECMALMVDKNVRHLPVIEAEKIVGIISIGDVVKVIIEQKEHHIEELENYIIGRR
jgi:CBS domain-containing protein